MKVIVFGATGMVGQGVLRECLLDDRVEKVLVIGRAPVHQSAPKLEQAVVPELFDLSSVADRMRASTRSSTAWVCRRSG